MNEDVLKVLGGGAAILLGLYALKERASGGSGASGSSGSSGTYSDAVVDGEESTAEGDAVFYPDSGISLSTGTDGIEPVIVDDYYKLYTPSENVQFMPTAKQDTVLPVEPVVETPVYYTLPEDVVITPMTTAEVVEAANVPYVTGYTPSETVTPLDSSSGSAVEVFTGIVDTAVETVSTVSVNPVVNTVVNTPVINAFETGKDVGKTVVETVINSDSPADAVNDVVTVIYETGKQTVDTAVNTGKQIVDTFVDTGKQAVDTAKETINNIGQNVNNWVDSWKWW